MLLHLHGDLAVDPRHVLAILDLSVVAGNRGSRAVLQQARAQGRLVPYAGVARAAVLVQRGKEKQVLWVLTGTSAQALRHRLYRTHAKKG